MSMTGKTTNELLPIGLSSDTVSIFDLNPIMEKLDSLIHTLQTNDSLTASDIESINSSITELTTKLTTVTQTASTNATNLSSLQNSINALNTTLANHFANEMKTVTVKVPSITLASNGYTANATGVDFSDNIPSGYKPIGVIGWNLKNGAINLGKVSVTSSNTLFYGLKNLDSKSATFEPEFYVACFKSNL